MPVSGLLVQPVQLVLVAGLLVAGSRASSEESPLQRRFATSHGSPRAFGEKKSLAEEFNRTGVLQPEYQIRATLKPNNVTHFLYTGPPSTLLISPCSGPIFWSVSYVGPPEADEHTGDTKSQTGHWLVKQMVPGSPLFTYKGAESQNFTIPAANLYRIEMQPLASPLLDLKTRSPNTVLLYVTSDAMRHLPGNLVNPMRDKLQQPYLEFQQKWSRRRLIVSWTKSKVDPNQSSYLLAVTSGAHLHPPTLCAAENIPGMKKHPCLSRATSALQPQYRGEPEGLHCVRKTKLTLFGVKNNTTYYFTLYIINTHSNVSSRVAMDKFKFERQPPIILKSGQYTTANLRKSRGFAVFRYRPRDNTTTIFNILACGVCSVKAKFRGPGYFLDEQIGGVFDLRAPALPPGKRFSIQITASQSDLVKMSRVKILATEGESSQFTDNSAMRDKPWEYRTLHKCRASWCSSSRASRTSSTGGSSTAGPYSKEGSSSSGSSGSSGTNSSPTAPSRRNPAHSLTRPFPSP